MLMAEDSRAALYHKGKRQGPCIEEDKNGKRFEGTYRNDVRDGRFVEKRPQRTGYSQGSLRKRQTI